MFSFFFSFDMDSKSRLPKPAALRPPQVTRPIFDRIQSTSITKAPTISRLQSGPQCLKRRSKSVTDLRSFANHPIPKLSELKKIPENSRSKVMTK